MPSHAEAREILADAWRQVYLSDLRASGLQLLQAQAWLETRYGAGWKGAGVDSHNWGAVQASAPPCDPATSFPYGDTHPKADGTSESYQACFRRYASDMDGASDFIRKATPTRSNSRALKSGNALQYATALYDSGYYEGRGKTRAARIGGYARALDSLRSMIAEQLGEKVLDYGKRSSQSKAWIASTIAGAALILGGIAYGRTR